MRGIAPHPAAFLRIDFKRIPYYSAFLNAMQAL